MFEQEIRDAAYVPRWGIARVNRRQYLPEHQYFVAVYADQIAEFIGWNGDRVMLFRCALWHDMGETITADPPGPAKRMGIVSIDKARLYEALKLRYGDYAQWARDAGPGVREILKTADLLDECMYIYEEASLGNSTMLGDVLTNSKTNLQGAIGLLPCGLERKADLWKLIGPKLKLYQHAKNTSPHDLPGSLR